MDCDIRGAGQRRNVESPDGVLGEAIPGATVVSARLHAGEVSEG